MFHAILITHAHQSDRLKKAQELSQTKLKPSPDILILEPDPSITIKQVLDLEVFLSKKPYQHENKIVLIKDAHLLTLPAQHAILKTLEEPPANSIIILLAPNSNNLLDTIVSRCQLLKLKLDSKLDTSLLKDHKQLFDTIASSNLSKKINLASVYAKNKPDALEFCHNQLMLLKPNIKKHHKLIKKLLTAIDQLNANVNPKLALESLLLKY